jgi:hypothetical protein
MAEVAEFEPAELAVVATAEAGAATREEAARAVAGPPS